MTFAVLRCGLLEEATTNLLPAVPRMIERIGSPSATALLNFFRYSAPNPSARPYPSAASSKVWQVPVGDRTPAFMVPSCCSGDWSRFDAATIAASHSPASSAVHAWCRLYSEAEQPVSSVKLLHHHYP